MGLAGERGGDGGRLLRRIGLAPVGCQVIDDAGGGVVEQRGRHRPLGIREELVDLGLGQVGAERCGQPVAGRWVVLRLSHHRGADDHAEGVEGHRRAVAVGVHDQRRLQDAIVVARDVTSGCVGIDVAFADRDPVAERIARLLHQQVVGVVGDEALGADRIGVERVAVAVRQEEVLPGVGQLLGRRIGRVRGVEDLPGGDPPVGVAFGVDVAALRSVEHRVAERGRRRPPRPGPA